MSEVEGTKFKVLEVSGEAHDRGFQYGAICKKNLSQLVPIWYSIYQSFNISKEQIMRDARKLFPFIEEYSPEIADEMKGTAEGAEVQLEEIVMITAFCEMFYPRAFSSSCTSFAVTKNASADKRSYIGQTNDEAESLWMGGESYVLVLFRRPSGPSVLTYTYAGVPVDLGINSDGIGLCSTAVTCEDIRLGVPRMILSREVLHQRTLTDAIGAVTRAKRANSLHFLIAGGSGEICDIEGTPSQFDYFYFKDTLAHTNHFLSSKLAIN
jgi:isopenicillin-N N-acyltransferase-like protein